MRISNLDLQNAIEFLRARNRTGVLADAPDHCKALDVIIDAYDITKDKSPFVEATPPTSVNAKPLTFGMGILGGGSTPEQMAAGRFQTCPDCHGPLTSAGCLRCAALARAEGYRDHSVCGGPGREPIDCGGTAADGDTITGACDGNIPPGFMSPVSDPSIKSCTMCGYSWPTGSNGEHSCTTVLFNRLIAAIGTLNAVDAICDNFTVRGKPVDDRVRDVIAGLNVKMQNPTVTTNDSVFVVCLVNSEHNVDGSIELYGPFPDHAAADAWFDAKRSKKYSRCAIRFATPPVSS